MPTTRRSRTLAAPPDRIWAVVADPHHLPRWWPRVTRVEGVDEDSWTQVFQTKKGRPVRADFRLVESDPVRYRAWAQELEDSPFERMLSEAVTDVSLTPSEHGTVVTLQVRQRLRGLARLGGFLARRGTRTLLDDALDGLERACG
jgi:uncharacterized protein YndB with AHSA1/START domain